MSIRYGQKTSTLADTRVSSSFVGFNRNDRAKLPVSLSISVTRPSDYIAIPSISSSEQKVALLVFVSNDSSNFLAFTVAGNYTVDWGDGVTENVSSGVAAQHIYNYSTFDPTNTTLNAEGFKQALVIITPQGGANLTSLNFQTRHSSANSSNYYSQPIRELYLSAPNLTSLTIGTTTPTTSVYPRFLRYANLINTGSLTSLANIFYNAYALTSIDIGSIGSVTSMASMFYQCYNLKLINFTVSNNTANVTNTSNMFAYCYSLQTVPLFNTGSVINMASMFIQCYNLTSVPLFNTVSATSIATIFYNCSSLTNVPLFNTINVTSMAQAFYGCSSLLSVPLFNTGNVTTMSQTFSYCYKLTTIPLFNTAKVTDMSSMFLACYSLIAVPLFNTVSVGNMAAMFSQCYSLTAIPLFNTASVTSMSQTFYQCFSLTTVPLFNTVSVTNMSQMFAYCYNLNIIPLFNTANVTNMSNMFYQCYDLITVPLFNTVKVTSMANMFFQCYALTSIPLFNTPVLTSLNNTFSTCINLETIPLIDTSKVTDWTSAFANCYNLSNLPALACNVGNIFTSTFGSCFSLATIAMTSIAYTADFSNCKLSKDALETLFANLATAASGATRTLTLTNNWGAPTPVSLTGTTTAGSTTITMANTTGLSAGMQVTGTNTSLTTGRSVTFTDVGDLVNLVAHGLSDGDEVSFPSITTTTGIVINVIYYVINSTADSFQVAATLGGSALPLTTNGSGTVKYNSTIVSIVANTSVTMSRPMAGSASQTLAFRQLGTYKAILKGFAITG